MILADSLKGLQIWAVFTGFTNFILKAITKPQFVVLQNAFQNPFHRIAYE